MNAAQCHSCLDVIVSTHVHDFRECQCGDVAVDGGDDYSRRLFRTGAEWTELTTDSELNKAIMLQYKTQSGV